MQTGLACGAAEGGGEPGGHLHPAACALPRLSSVGQRGDVSAAVIHGLRLHPSPIHELSLLCRWSGTVSPVTCRHSRVCRQGVISCINPKSSFLSCELWGFSAPLKSKGGGPLPVTKTGVRPHTDPSGAEPPFPISVKSGQMQRCGPSAAREGHAGSESTCSWSG